MTQIIAGREILTFELQKSGWNVLPSGANFVMAGKNGFSGVVGCVKYRPQCSHFPKHLSAFCLPFQLHYPF
ncbi:hypothetical protein QUF90_24130 [Desulfococcaceae bacterium HSG9]|nr:hypothetical protein [Desulfococcaceae bacterium HSG9]